MRRVRGEINTDLFNWNTFCAIKLLLRLLSNWWNPNRAKVNQIIVASQTGTLMKSFERQNTLGETQDSRCFEFVIVVIHLKMNRHYCWNTLVWNRFLFTSPFNEVSVKRKNERHAKFGLLWVCPRCRIPNKNTLSYITTPPLSLVHGHGCTAIRLSLPCMLDWPSEVYRVAWQGRILPKSP